MTSQQIKQLGNTVGFTMAISKPEVKALLKRSGVPVNSYSDAQIREAVVDKVINDQKFNARFDKIAKSSAKAYLKATNQGTKNFGGYSNFTAPDFSGLPSTTQPAQTNSGGSSFDWGGLAGGLLSAGTGIFGSIQSTKAQQRLAEQQAKLAELEAQTALGTANAQIEIEKLRLAQLQASQSTGTNPTLIYVGIGLVGLLVVGGIVLAVRK